jgi:hypothetical protein
LKTPESELNADKTMQIWNYGDETEPPTIMEEAGNATEILKNNKSPGLICGRTIKIWW